MHVPKELWPCECKMCSKKYFSEYKLQKHITYRHQRLTEGEPVKIKTEPSNKKSDKWKEFVEKVEGEQIECE